MSPLFADVFDLYRFRVRALPSYRYPLWQMALFLSLIGVVLSGSMPELGHFVPGRIGFCVLYNALETLLFTAFIGIWLRVRSLRLYGPLFTLLALAGAVQFLGPLLDWLPDDVGQFAALLLWFYLLVVLCHALIKVSGASRFRVVSGVLLFVLLSQWLEPASWFVASKTGWVKSPGASWWKLAVTPPGSATPAAPAQATAAAAAGADDSKAADPGDDFPL
jgi:hypothetical protein